MPRVAHIYTHFNAIVSRFWAFCCAIVAMGFMMADDNAAFVGHANTIVGEAQSLSISFTSSTPKTPWES